MYIYIYAYLYIYLCISVSSQFAQFIKKKSAVPVGRTAISVSKICLFQQGPHAYPSSPLQEYSHSVLPTSTPSR